jgi:hypothetical protein
MMCTNHAQLWALWPQPTKGVIPDADVAVVQRGGEQPE